MLRFDAQYTWQQLARRTQLIRMNLIMSESLGVHQLMNMARYKKFADESGQGYVRFYLVCNRGSSYLVSLGFNKRQPLFRRRLMVASQSFLPSLVLKSRDSLIFFLFSLTSALIPSNGGTS